LGLKKRATQDKTRCLNHARAASRVCDQVI
jgi:hypothetical protein